jgi:hypothetical protein
MCQSRLTSVEMVEVRLRRGVAWWCGRALSAKVELRQLQPWPRGDPMSEERLALSELPRKAGEGDFLRAVAEAVLQLLMEADRS